VVRPIGHIREPAPHKVLGLHQGSVRSGAVGELNGRPVVVSGGEDGMVRVWDLARGEAVGEPLRGHGGGRRARTGCGRWRWRSWTGVRS
jgi:WD40 repeat protein